jgi:hypothetical protein
MGKCYRCGVEAGEFKACAHCRDADNERRKASRLKKRRRAECEGCFRRFLARSDRNYACSVECQRRVDNQCRFHNLTRMERLGIYNEQQRLCAMCGTGMVGATLLKRSVGWKEGAFPVAVCGYCERTLQGLKHLDRLGLTADEFRARSLTKIPYLDPEHEWADARVQRAVSRKSKGRRIFLMPRARR